MSSSLVPIPVVLVGCGAVSRLFYTPALAAAETAGQLRLHAVVDPSETARESLRASFPRAQAHARLDDADLPDGALAIVASPPRFHREQTLAALARGWHVLCEKPMAAASRDCETMHRAALAAGRILAVGHYKRFFPSSGVLKTLCAGLTPLGALQRFHLHEGGPFDWPAASPSFFRREETPGGVLLDIGVHVFDLLLWWLGEPDEIAHRDDAMGGLETNTLTDFRFGPVRGRVQLSRDWKTPQRYRFEFARGSVSWTVNDANGLTLRIEGLPLDLRGALIDREGTHAATNPQSFIAQLLHVAGAIRTGSPVLVDGREGARALRLIETCYARKRPLPQPWLTPDEQAAAGRLALPA
ncbi:hypothetical protein OPIT5_22465 [Opitutaceae bacterium TAV5]|nr:hypothetical protein OPIT5_22465 [Opitutaceae bacterium TAV5]